jgi:translation initiation factor RLI1
MEYQIIDNYLSEEKIQNLKNSLMSPNFPYYFQDSVSVFSNTDPKYYFNHSLYYYNSVQSWFYTQIMNPILENLQPKTLLRAKVNCFCREKTNYIHEFHVDDSNPHKVGLLSINTNNGKTILKIDNELIEIDSVENRMIIFNGSISHAPMSQTDTKIRVNVNFNFLE